jgi:hypothetical protein
MFLLLIDKSTRREKLWLRKYVIRATRIVSIFPMKVERKNTIPRVISSLKKVNKREKRMRLFISIPFIQSIRRNRIDWSKIIIPIVIENQRNFPSMNSCLLIGFERIRKIVFPSTSLNKS